MAEKGISRVPLESWQAESLRLTAFPSPSEDIVAANWWADLMGEPPEVMVSRPKRGGQQEEGPFEGGKLGLRIQRARPNRIDWVLIPAEVEEPETFPIVGNFAKALGPFTTLIHRWFDLKTSPYVQRLAFACVVLLPVENRQVGYHQLSAYLPSVDLDHEGSSDFSYQINRRRDSKSGIPGLNINRLSKWSVSLIESFAVSIDKRSLIVSSGEPGPSACRIELDINTSRDFEGLFSREQVHTLFDELVELGCEIIAKGDIP